MQSYCLTLALSLSPYPKMTMVKSGLTYRSVNPDAFRVSFDGHRRRLDLEAHGSRQATGSLAPWGVDTMPLMDRGGRGPSGDADTFEIALAAFKAAFTKWPAALPPGLWETNRDYIRGSAARCHTAHHRWRNRSNVQLFASIARRC